MFRGPLLSDNVIGPPDNLGRKLYALRFGRR